MIGQYLPNKTKVVLFIGLKFFQHLNVASVHVPLKIEPSKEMFSWLVKFFLCHIRYFMGYQVFSDTNKKTNYITRRDEFIKPN
jgi:hypothetical protein